MRPRARQGRPRADKRPQAFKEPLAAVVVTAEETATVVVAAVEHRPPTAVGGVPAGRGAREYAGTRRVTPGRPERPPVTAMAAEAAAQGRGTSFALMLTAAQVAAEPQTQVVTLQLAALPAGSHIQQATDISRLPRAAAMRGLMATGGVVAEPEVATPPDRGQRAKILTSAPVAELAVKVGKEVKVGQVVAVVAGPTASTHKVLLSRLTRPVPSPAVLAAAVEPDNRVGMAAAAAMEVVVGDGTGLTPATVDAEGVVPAEALVPVEVAALEGRVSPYMVRLRHSTLMRQLR